MIEIQYRVHSNVEAMTCEMETRARDQEFREADDRERKEIVVRQCRGRLSETDETKAVFVRLCQTVVRLPSVSIE